MGLAYPLRKINTLIVRSALANSIIGQTHVKMRHLITLHHLSRQYVLLLKSNLLKCQEITHLSLFENSAVTAAEFFSLEETPRHHNVIKLTSNEN